MIRLLQRVLCRLLGHEPTCILTGARTDRDDGLQHFSFTDDRIRWRCERCGLEREPTEDERRDAMRRLAEQVLAAHGIVS